MNVFDIIPSDFFNCLAVSSNRRVYADCMELIYNQYDKEISYRLERSYLRDVLAAFLLENHLNLSDEENDSSAGNDEANFVLRKFISVGWLEEDQDDATFEKFIVMTDNGIALAEFLQKLKRPATPEFSSYILNIYNRFNSKEYETKQELYNFILKPTFTDAKSLSSSLKKLSTSIKKIIEKMNHEGSLESLTENIISYCDGDFIKEYSGLVHQQNIHIYRNFITRKLDEMKLPEYFSLLCTELGMEEKSHKNQISNMEAEDRIYEMIDSTKKFLHDDYNKIMDDIKQKINTYIHIAIARERMLRNKGLDIRGVVEQALRILISSEDLSENTEVVPLFNIQKHEYVDHSSVMYPHKSQQVLHNTESEYFELSKEEIEQKTSEYEKVFRNFNVRELMFRYQYINQYKDEITKFEVSYQNSQIQLHDLEEKKKEAEEKLSEMRRRLSEVENKNHTITESLNKMEKDKEDIRKKISDLENELSKLKNLQISLKVILPQITNYFEISDESRTVLLNLSENDFPSDKKISTFIDFSNKIKNQRDLFVGENYLIENKLADVTNKISEVQKRIKNLESNIRQFPAEAEEAKRIIQNEFNKRGIKCQVRLFAELVESLNDERWRKSIETFLWNKRYNIIVDDEYCHDALSILNEKNIYKASVILTDKIPETEVEENSAASVLNITNKGARRYANYLLNGIYLCENLEELHEHPKGGITKDGLLCKSYAASKMQIQKTALCLGNNVIKIQLEQARKEFDFLSLEKSGYEKDIQNRKQLVTLIDNVEWKPERYNFNSSRELSEENRNLGRLVSQIEELKNSPEMLAAAREYEMAKSNYDEADKNSKLIERNLGSTEKEISNIQDRINETVEKSAQKEKEYKEISELHPELINEMKDEYERAFKQRNNFIVISSRHLQNLANDVDNAKRKMEDKQREYNILSEIETSNYGVEFIPFYRDRYRDVANVKIDEAKNKVEKQSEKLRDVFLHDFVAELNEKIIAAKEEIAAINSELKRIPFGRDIYQFKMEEKTDRQVFFTICKNLELYSESPDLFTERTVSDEKLADDVQSFLNKILDTEQEEDYSDYRNYFTYDMTIRSHIGDEESEMDLSKKQGSASGGEKQTPYFIVLAASLMQFYPKDVCCARIAFIDEAFSALSKERIEQMVKFLEDNNFQVFYAAPPEKINSIGQHINNTVSLYTHGKYTKPVEGAWYSK